MTEERSGVVETIEPRALYRVRLDDGTTVTASLKTEAKRAIVHLLPGDRVAVSVSPNNPTRGRITGKD